jgi:hypothetical protein
VTAPIPPAIVIGFAQFEDDLTGERKVEARAFDPATSAPVLSCSLRRMAGWLRDNGYSWRVGSNGVWARGRASRMRTDETMLPADTALPAQTTSHSPRVHDHRAAAAAKPWVCRSCNRRFRRVEHLDQHRRDTGCET